MKRHNEFARWDTRFTILGSPEQKTVLDYVMAIEFKNGYQKFSMEANNIRQIGRYARAAKALPDAKECDPNPRSQLNAKGAGFETHSIAHLFHRVFKR